MTSAVRLTYNTVAVFRKTLTILSLTGLLLSMGLWGVSYLRVYIFLGGNYSVGARNGLIDVYRTPDYLSLLSSKDEYVFCLGDVNGDATANVLDLIELLGAWGPNLAHPADFNVDDVVNAADLAQLLGSWRPCL